MILKINNQRFDYFDNVNINLTFNAISSTFKFDGYFDPNNSAQRNLFKPLRYSKIEIEHNGETILIGRKVHHKFKSTAKPELASISGYSLTGVLEDSSIPTSIYPLQSDNLSLKDIAEKLLKPFDIAVVIDSAVEDRVNEIYDSSDAKVDGTVKDYLTKLASQKSIIVTHTNQGALLLTEAKPNLKPIADLSNVPEKELTVDDTKLHSSITALKEADINGGNAGENELDNGIIQSFRPKVVTQTSGDDNDTELAAKKVRAAELSAIRLVITLETWTINNRVIKPNQIISVQDPDLYLFKKTNWFIESVNLKGNSKSQTSILTCVLPQVYNNQDPINPFS